MCCSQQSSICWTMLLLCVLEMVSLSIISLCVTSDALRDPVVALQRATHFTKMFGLRCIC